MVNNFPVLTKESINLCESEYKRSTGFSDKTLMELSGFACAKEILNFYGPFNDDHIVIYAGPGKNGGDGIVTAYFLAPHTKQITICMPATSSLDFVNENIARIKNFCANVTFTSDIVDGDIYIDALFGTGFNQKSGAGFEKIIEHINNQPNSVISIDLPSGVGIDVDSTSNFGAIKPDLTLAVGCLKSIHKHSKTSAICGNVVLLDIGLPFILLQKHAENQKVAC